MMEVFPVPSSPITRILYRCSFFSGFPAYNNIQQRYQTGKDFLAYNIQQYQAWQDALSQHTTLEKKPKDISNIRHDRISCQHYTRNISGMAVIKYIWHCWISSIKDIRHGRSSYNIGFKDIRHNRISFLQLTTNVPEISLTIAKFLPNIKTGSP